MCDRVTCKTTIETIKLFVNMTTEQVLGLIFTNLLDNKWFGEVDSEMNIDAMFNYLVGFRIRGV